MTRAQLLRWGAAVAVGAGLPTIATAPAGAAARRRGALSRSRFAPHIGSAFLIERTQGGHVRVELAEIRDLPGARGSELAYSLIFHGRERDAVGQGTVTFSHRALGRLRLFQVPIFTIGRGQDYEVIVEQRGRLALVRASTYQMRSNRSLPRQASHRRTAAHRTPRRGRTGGSRSRPTRRSAG